jgi:UDP-N-acetylmuramoyl-tripeptide--D-alanyl-D-alanine ligase
LIGMTPEEIADAMSARIVSEGGEGAPASAGFDSRQVSAGELFFGLPGESDDGGRFAPAAVEAGAWGVVTGPDHTAAAVATAERQGHATWVFESTDPLRSLQDLATAWRRRLGATVVGITGSVGKTSVKDITRALLPGVVHASPENFNTEVGLPLTVLSAPEDTEYLVLEMAMRGPGQIAELARMGEPDVGVITNVGPVHIELLGSIEAIAAAKAEMIDGVVPGSPVVVPVDAGYLEPHLAGVETLLRFGPGGAVELVSSEPTTSGIKALIRTPSGEFDFEFPFTERHNVTNALTAIAIGHALGVDPGEMAGQTGRIAFSKLRGEHIELDGGALIVNDSYNANPVSMRAALDYLAGLDRPQRIAVMGLMAELGPDTDRFHAEIGAHARDVGIDVLIGVGRVAAGYAPDHLVADPAAAAELVSTMLAPGTAVLVKGSRSAGLEAVTEALSRSSGDGHAPESGKED